MAYVFAFPTPHSIHSTNPSPLIPIQHTQLLAPTAFQCYTPRIFLGREVRTPLHMDMDTHFTPPLDKIRLLSCHEEGLTVPRSSSLFSK